MIDKVIKAGIVGATGYTGGELIRLLLMHPRVEIAVVTSRSEAGREVTELFPNLRHRIGLAFTAPDMAQLGECDVVFFATPNGTAMTMVPDLLRQGVRVVDLSADFRIKDSRVWSHWYGMAHACPELLEEAVYGLPEMNRQDIATAQLVANPGCYPTAVQLGFLPLLEKGLIDPASLIANTVSGVSGAGRKASVGLLFSEVDENFKAYNVAGHRHQPEIVQGLRTATRQTVHLTFVPHLAPMVRGIHATLYGRVLAAATDLHALFEQRFADEPFVDVLPAGQHVETRAVTGGNHCRIAVVRPRDEETVVVLSVIDNLIKGAAGQAVQNMNLMFGCDETVGLESIAMIP